MKNKIIFSVLSIFLISCGSREVRNISSNNENVESIGNRTFKIRNNEPQELIEKKEEKKINTDIKVHIVEATNDTLLPSQLNSQINSGFNYYNNIHAKSGLSEHPKEVLSAFLDYNINNKLDGNEKTTEFKDKVKVYSRKRVNIDDLKGIINMSYGHTESSKNLDYFLNENAKYNDISRLNDEYFKEYFSQSITNSNYKKNDQLKIKALGNSVSTEWETASTQQIYQILSPYNQKKARNDLIYVKNILTPEYIKKINGENNNKRIYSIGNEEYYELNNNARAMLLRSFTVAQDGFLNDKVGSSLSAPRVSRLAYEILKKYPFLRYNQVKQIILTTTKSNRDYLDNKIGWGIVNNEKALKGIGALNKGLIEEESFYEGMSDKIYDEKGNIYAYIDIPNNTYEWSNDIEGGLTGSGDNKEDETLEIKGKKYRIPKVLDSEKRYYESAGLRKVGQGKLILSGKQNYNTITKVEEGILELKNESKSKYEIYDKGTLILNNSKISNDVESNGKVEIIGNTEVKNYYATKNSTTTFKENSKLKGDEVYINSIGYKGDAKKGEKLAHIEAKKLNVEEVKLNNIFLKLTKVEKGKYELKDDTDKATRYLKNLSEIELRNIPSYDINAKKFFDKYQNGNFSLANIQALTESEVFEKIFTDNYTTSITQNSETFDEIQINNIEEMQNKPKDSIYFNLYNSFNFKNNINYSKFTHNLYGITLGVKKKINNSVNLGAIFSKYNGKYNFSNENSINSDIYGVNIMPTYSKNNFEINLDLGYLRSFNKAKRNISDNIMAESDFNTHNLSFNINAKIIQKINENISIIPKIGYKKDLTIIPNFSEKILDENYKKYAINVKNNKIDRNQINLGLGISFKYNKINIINSFDYIHNFNENINLLSNINGSDIELEGKKLDKNIFRYNVEMAYKINDKFNISTRFNVDSRKKVGISTSIIYIFE